MRIQTQRPSGLLLVLCGTVMLFGSLTSRVVQAESPAEKIVLQTGDRICIVGNELGERLQHHNHFESLLHATAPELQLVVRNLCFPGDEVVTRIRSMNFGSPDSHLQHSQASVILYFFGYNESFSGETGVEKFANEYRELLAANAEQNYSGQGAPRIILVSPIAFENTGDPHLPTGEVQNANLALYTDAIGRVAATTGAGFVDLFTPTKELFESSDKRLTLNGSHLNDLGYQELAPILVRGILGKAADGYAPQVKTAVEDKNFHWWHRYRAVNGYSIYGARGRAGSDGTYNNTDVMERERAILDQMTANRDARIFALAAGQSVDGPVDDSNTLPFINPRTNVGGPDDKQAKLGKLGSLDYLPAEEQQKLFKLPDGYEIQLVASEQQFPELANPVALDFDGQGRLWVSTMASYPQWKPKTKLDDKLLILEDTDGDGTADECKVFADGLHQPTGFEIGSGGVYVAQQPDILFLEDSDGDDVADKRIRKLVGLDSADSHHGISAFVWGPGGNLYFNEGTFKFSQVESPYGVTRLGEAGVWKYNPKTQSCDVHASFAFANPWGHVFDYWGQDFIADASPGFSYWAAPISGHIEYPNKHPGGAQHKRVAAFGGGDPKYRHPTFYPKRTRPSAGAEFVSSEHFPEDAQGNFLLTNCIGDRAVLNHKVSEDGTGLKGEEVTPLVYCEDGNFRPVDVQFGPDGALYIVDWHNALIGHLQHNLREPNRDTSHGRIWRVTYKGRPLTKFKNVEELSTDELLDELKLSADRLRYAARRELATRDTEEVIAEAAKWLESLDAADPAIEHHKLEALWLHQTHQVVNLTLLKEILSAKDHRARAAGVRVLSAWVQRLPSALELIAVAIADENPRVRLEAVRALSFVKADQAEAAIETALEVLNNDLDDYLQYTLDETMRTLESL